jgi:hypothetical protein
MVTGGMQFQLQVGTQTADAAILLKWNEIGDRFGIELAEFCAAPASCAAIAAIVPCA